MYAPERKGRNSGREAKSTKVHNSSFTGSRVMVLVLHIASYLYFEFEMNPADSIKVMLWKKE